MNRRFVLRLMLPTIVIALILVVLGGISGWYVHQLQKSSAESLSLNVAKVTAAEELLFVSHDLRHELSQYLATGEQSHIAAAQEMNVLAKKWLAQSEALAETPEEAASLKRIRSGYDKLYSTYSLLASTSQPKYRDIVSKLVHGVVTADILVPIVHLRRMIGDSISEASRRDQMLADRMGMGLLVLGACGAVSGLLAGYGFAQGIHHSMVKLSIPIHDAAGRLDEVVGPIEIAADDFHGLESTMHAVANRVEAVIEDLRSSQEIARRSEQLASLGRLAAGIAHELRNPLTSMKIIIQTALDEQNPAQLDERDLAVLGEEISRLDSTIQSFLDYARPPKLVKSPTNVAQEVQRTVELASHRANQMGITVQTDFSDSPNSVLTDPAQLRQVILNLLINALEASPEGSTVSVRASCEANSAQHTDTSEADLPCWMRLDIEDYGPGISEDVRQRLFEPFFTTKDTGTGLGLAICKRIVDDLGGEIAAENRVEGGTRFTMRLPIAEPC